MEESFLHKVYNLLNNIIHLNELKSFSQIESTPATGKHCPITGLDISMQPKNSKFLSYTGVKWYHENDFVTKEPTAVPLAGPANKQGRIVADNIAGRKSEFVGVTGAAVVKVFDITVSQVGLNEKKIKQTGIKYEKVYTYPINHPSYYPNREKMAIKVLFEVPSGKILGAQIIGGSGAEKRTDIIATVIYYGGTVFDLEELEVSYAPPYNNAKTPVNNDKSCPFCLDFLSYAIDESVGQI